MSLNIADLNHPMEVISYSPRLYLNIFMSCRFLKFCEPNHITEIDMKKGNSQQSIKLRLMSGKYCLPSNRFNDKNFDSIGWIQQSHRLVTQETKSNRMNVSRNRMCSLLLELNLRTMDRIRWMEGRKEKLPHK